jgi:hypothetical protein
MDHGFTIPTAYAHSECLNIEVLSFLIFQKYCMIRSAVTESLF